MKKLRMGLLLLISCLTLTGCGCAAQKEYTVTFDSDGGSKVATQNVKANERVVKPADPEKDDYTFGGWYLNLDDETSYDFNTKVTGNITLYAKWEGNGSGETGDSFTISFSSDGGSSVRNKTIKKGQKIGSLPTPTRKGYKFLGWYNGDELVTEDTVVNSLMSLTAKWEKTSSGDKTTTTTKKVDKDKTTSTTTKKKTTYTVTFDSDGGSKVDSVKVEKNKTVSEPKAPTKDGYKFLGWYNGNTKYDFSSKVTKKLTLKAKWEKLKADVYTFKTEPIEAGNTETYRLTIYKNGKKVTAAEGMQVVKNGKRLSKYQPMYKDMTVSSGNIGALKGATLEINGSKVTLQ